MRLKIHWASLVGGKFMLVIICSRFLLKFALRTQTFLISAMQVLCRYRPRKSKPRLKSEFRKQQYTVTLFDCSHLSHVIGLWQMQKFLCYSTVFPRTDDLSDGFFPLRVWVGIYLEGLIHVGAYFRNVKEIRNQYNSNEIRNRFDHKR